MAAATPAGRAATCGNTSSFDGMHGLFPRFFKPDKVMSAELSKTDQDRTVSPHAQEIEYALSLQHMINSVKDDPAQMRLAIYEFARARMQLDASWADADEKERLNTALETAIQGVEQFSLRREEFDRLAPPTSSRPMAALTGPAGTINPAPEDVLPSADGSRFGVQSADARPRSRVWMLASVGIGMLLFGATASLVYFRDSLPVLRDHSTASLAVGAAPSVPQPAIAPNAARPGPAKPPPFPVPSDYGIYALSANDALSELHVLSERVPDKRISVSTPVEPPSGAPLPDGKARFILYRRDLANNAPERIEVRVVARVVRAVTFDTKGRPNITPVSDAWNIRSISYPFRVRPIPDNPEMLLVQSEKPDFILPPGRYVLVLKDQGYDFTIAGQATELSHCLERTDAANGEFYSECQKL